MVLVDQVVLEVLEDQEVQEVREVQAATALPEAVVEAVEAVVPTDSAIITEVTGTLTIIAQDI